jgi:hypothetical protein
MIPYRSGFGQQEQEKNFMDQLLPVGLFDVVKANLDFGREDTLVNMGARKLRDATQQLSGRMLSPVELNDMFEGMITVPFTESMDYTKATQLQKDIIKRRQLETIISLTPNTLLWQGPRFDPLVEDIGDSIFANFLEGVINFPTTILNLAGINPLLQEVPSLAEESAAMMVMGPLSKIGTTAIRRAAISASLAQTYRASLPALKTFNTFIAARNFKTGLMRKAGTKGRDIIRTTPLDLGLALGQTEAINERQRYLREEVTEDDNFTQAFASVAAIRMGQFAKYKIGNYLKNKSQLSASIQSLDADKDPGAVVDAIEQVDATRLTPPPIPQTALDPGSPPPIPIDVVRPGDATNLPSLPENRVFTPLKYNNANINKIDFYAAKSGGQFLPTAKNLGEGLYVSDNPISPNNVAVDPTTRNNLLRLRLKKNLKMLDLNKKITQGDRKALAKVFSDAVDLFTGFTPMPDIYTNKNIPEFGSIIEKTERSINEARLREFDQFKKDLIDSLEDMYDYNEVLTKVESIADDYGNLDINPIEFSNYLNNFFKKKGFDGYSFIDGFEPGKVASNSAMLFDPNTAISSLEESKRPDPNQIDDVPPEILEEAKSKLNSPESDFGRLDVESVYEAELEKAPAAPVDHLAAIQDADLAQQIQSFKDSFETLDPEVKAILNKEIENLGDIDTITNKELKLIDNLEACGI